MVFSDAMDCIILTSSHFEWVSTSVVYSMVVMAIPTGVMVLLMVRNLLAESWNAVWLLLQYLHPS